MADMKWIPISEKFPQEDEDVLLQFPSNQGVGYYEDGDWIINTGDGIYCTIGYNEEKPIAWMPLPEPYKKDAPASNDDDAAHYLLKKHSEMALKELEGAWRLAEARHKHKHSNN